MKQIATLIACLAFLAGCAVYHRPCPHCDSDYPGILPPPGGEAPGHAARVSSWDRSGKNADSIRIAPGETAILADISGPGIIRHIWSTTNATGPFGRTLVLRIYWDGADTPAVEAPYGDFFGVGHGLEADVDSAPIDVTSRGRSRNCWWRMPFASRALVTLTNEGNTPNGALYYYIDYLSLDAPPHTGQRFFAQYRQAFPADQPENYTILDTRGRGYYMGCVFSVESTSPNWWGEGDDLIEADDHEPLRVTGTEDYFCDAWGLREHLRPHHGAPVCQGFDLAGLRSSLYRFHIPDPIPFQKSIRVSIEHGSENDRADNLSSVAFWYQIPPAMPQPPLPPALERLTGVERADLIRARAWHLATLPDDQDGALKELKNRALYVEDTIMIEGLRVYATSKITPSGDALQKLDELLAALEERIALLPEEELRTARVRDVPTDDDAPVLKAPLLARETLMRARMDLGRRAARIHGFRAGDEIIIEARDASGERTPAPDYEDTPDFNDSYAKAEDIHSMGSGARFTYGGADPSQARFTPDFPAAGRYEVFVIFSYGANAGDTRYIIRHTDGETVIPLPQHGRPDTDQRNNQTWISLGTFHFDQGRNASRGAVILDASRGQIQPHPKHEYRAYADAVRLVFLGK